MSFWKALLYLGVPQSGYHPTWPDWLPFLGWWIGNPLPGLTEFWLGLKKPIEVYEQIGGQWFLRKALRRQNKSAQTLHLSKAMPNGTRPVENILHSASDRNQDRDPYEDLADTVKGQAQPAKRLIARLAGFLRRVGYLSALNILFSGFFCSRAATPISPRLFRSNPTIFGYMRRESCSQVDKLFGHLDEQAKLLTIRSSGAELVYAKQD